MDDCNSGAGTGEGMLFAVRRLQINFICRPNFISCEFHKIDSTAVKRLRTCGAKLLFEKRRWQQEGIRCIIEISITFSKNLIKKRRVFEKWQRWKDWHMSDYL